MGYLSIPNLYREQLILLFKECYALEKVHGSSAHIEYIKGERLQLFPGGESPAKFEALFNKDELIANFEELGRSHVTIYGEVYGGKCQKMSDTYGPDLRFIGFDVLSDGFWLEVPDMDETITKFGLEVVPWEKVTTDIDKLNELRDKPSEVAQRRGMGIKKREGVVLRPLKEFTDGFGNRVIVKHKGKEFSERTTPQKVEDPSKLVVLTEAQKITDEWCVFHRLEHVLQKIENPTIEKMPIIMNAMYEDIIKESKGEIVESKELRGCVNKKTAQLFKEWLQKQLEN